MELRNKVVVVTGGAGFIGSHMVDLLRDRGIAVRVLDNLVGGRADVDLRLLKRRTAYGEGLDKTSKLVRLRGKFTFCTQHAMAGSRRSTKRCGHGRRGTIGSPFT